MRLPVRPRAVVARLRMVQDHPSHALERSSLGPRTSRRLQNHSSRSGASRLVAPVAQGGSQSGAPPQSKADAIARIYRETRKFGIRPVRRSRGGVSLLEARMPGIALGSANINQLIAYNEGALNGAIDAWPPAGLPCLVRSAVGGTHSRPDRATDRSARVMPSF